MRAGMHLHGWSGLRSALLFLFLRVFLAFSMMLRNIANRGRAALNVNNPSLKNDPLQVSMQSSHPSNAWVALYDFHAYSHVNYIFTLCLFTYLTTLVGIITHGGVQTLLCCAGRIYILAVSIALDNLDFVVDSGHGHAARILRIVRMLRVKYRFGSGLRGRALKPTRDDDDGDDEKTKKAAFSQSGPRW